jgi:hypothetical protein
MYSCNLSYSGGRTGLEAAKAKTFKTLFQKTSLAWWHMIPGDPRYGSTNWMGGVSQSMASVDKLFKHDLKTKAKSFSSLAQMVEYLPSKSRPEFKPQ